MGLETDVKKLIKLLKQGYTKFKAETIKREEWEKSIYDGMNSLIKSYVEEELSTTSDIVYNEQLSKSTIAFEDFEDLLSGEINEYTIRKHVREIMKSYLKSVSSVRKIRVRDKTRFGFEMESVGLNIGISTYNSWLNTRSMVPDGNVIILAGCALVISLYLISKMKV